MDKRVNNQLLANKPVAKHSSVLTAGVVHGKVGQWGHHLGWANKESRPNQKFAVKGLGESIVGQMFLTVQYDRKKQDRPLWRGQTSGWGQIKGVHALCDANEEMRYSARELSSEAKSKLGIVLQYPFLMRNSSNMIYI